jgi:hypothetical protein
MAIYASLDDVESMGVFQISHKPILTISFYAYLMPAFESYASKFYLLWIKLLDEHLRYVPTNPDSTSANATPSFTTTRSAKTTTRTISSSPSSKNYPYTITPCLIKYMQLVPPSSFANPQDSSISEDFTNCSNENFKISKSTIYLT